MLKKTLSNTMFLLFLAILSVSAFSLHVINAEGSWVFVRNTVSGAHGEAVVGTGDAIYIARGDRFYRYKPADNSFVRLADPPKPDGDAFKTGTALAWDFERYIYALYGAASGESRRHFYRYDILSDLWERLADTPYDQGEGDAITYVRGVGVYAIVGGEERPTCLLIYDPAKNIWSDEPSDPPAGTGDGAALVWTGDSYLYALRGEFEETTPLYDFWRYDILTNTWTVMAEIPASSHDGGVGGVGDGGSLLYVGFWLSNQTDYIYALSGNQAHPESIPDARTYRYKISTNTWERLADLPFGVGYYVGNRLGYADGKIYCWQGAPTTWAGGGDDLAYYIFQPEITEIYDLSVTASLIVDKIYFGQNATMSIYVFNEGTINLADPLVNIHLNEVVNVNLTLSGGIEPGRSLYRVFQITTVEPSLLGPVAPGNYTIYIKVYPFEKEVDVEDNICKLNFTVMPDHNAPLIETPMQNPPIDNIQPFQNVTVWVGVTDYESGVKNVTLFYSVDGYSWINIPMNLNLTKVLYEAIIPGQEANTLVKYKIIAYDNAGNFAVEDNNMAYYAYTVIPEFPFSIILLLALIFSTLSITVFKSRQRTKRF